MIFAQITDIYEIPPSAYQADTVFQRCLTLMQKFNIYELRDFQPGHLEPFKNYMFPHDQEQVLTPQTGLKALMPR